MEKKLCDLTKFAEFITGFAWFGRSIKKLGSVSKAVSRSASLILVYHLRVQISQDTRLDLNFDQVDRLHEPGLCGQGAGIQDPPGGGNDLPATTMDGVSMESNVVKIEADTAHVFVAQNSLK